MLQTIDLCVTNVWFTAYKAIVYSTQSYRLQHTKLSFTSSKPMLCVECLESK